MSKEAQRREQARKQQRNARAAKWTITGLIVMVVPMFIYVAMQG